MAWKDLSRREKAEVRADFWSLLISGLVAFLPAVAYMLLQVVYTDAYSQGSGEFSISRLNQNWNYEVTLTHPEPVASVSIAITGGGGFDTFQDSTGTHSFIEDPTTGRNNDDVQPEAVTLRFSPPIPGGATFSVRGDIDGNVRGFGATVTLQDGRSTSAALAQVSGQDIWRGSFGSSGGDPHPKPEPDPDPQDAQFVRFDQTERVGFVGDEVTLAWCQPGESPDSYELQIVQRETGAIAHEVSGIAGDVRRYRWTPTRAGHYFVQLRSCNLDSQDPGGPADLSCSDVTDSRTKPTEDCSGNPITDPAFPLGWVMYFKLKPPTDGGIEQ